MSNQVWDAENGWHDGPAADLSLDDKGRIVSTRHEDECPVCAELHADILKWHPLPNGAGIVPLPGDQPNETDNIPIGQTEDETPERES